MKKDEVLSIIKNNYDISASDCIELKNIYKIKTDNGSYCLKKIQYELPHLKFILGAMNHLQKRNFDRVPKFIRSVDGKDYIDFDGKYAYLIPWINSRLSNYDNPFDLKKAATKLAELHKCSEGFCLSRDMKPRNYWFKWPEIFRTRVDEILDFEKRINQKAHKTEFDKLFLSMIYDEIKRGLDAIEELKGSGYYEYMDKEVMKLCFCHHDYAHHNVLVDKNGKIIIIDFDYCILDSHLHDLSSLLIRTMKDGRWNINTAKFILNSYSEKKIVEGLEIPIMSAFIKFPQQFWQVGIQYYWEEQMWGEEFFMKKLTSYKEDIIDREEFLEEFRNFKYRS